MYAIRSYYASLQGFSESSVCQNRYTPTMGSHSARYPPSSALPLCRTGLSTWEYSLCSQTRHTPNRTEGTNACTETVITSYSIHYTKLYDQRYEKFGIEGLRMKDKAPINHPNRTNKEIEKRILCLKEKHQHWGAKKLRIKKQP